jgi:predicted ATPase
MDRAALVGRDVELTELKRRLESAIAGHGGLVLIGGEPGVGKTRLTQELAAAAVSQGVLVLYGRCYESEGAPPYIPYVECLEMALAGADDPEAFRAALGEEAAEVVATACVGERITTRAICWQCPHSCCRSSLERCGS